jgi:hypothetical protein
MVQRLFADVIHDVIWFMNIHEQNHPWFLAMWPPRNKWNIVDSGIKHHKPNESSL